MRFYRALLISVLLSLAVTPAFAGSTSLDFVADGDSRFFDLFSDAFAQLDQGYGGNPAADGYFRVSTEGPTPGVGVEADFDAFSPTIFDELGQGPSVFESEDGWIDIGAIVWDDATGDVTTLVLDFQEFVAFDDTALNFQPNQYLGYQTILSNVSGTVYETAGTIEGIFLAADVTFSYRGGAVEYAGTILFQGDRFDLFVDDDPVYGFNPYRIAWDVEGVVANVPEPRAGIAIALLAGAALTKRRPRLA